MKRRIKSNIMNNNGIDEEIVHFNSFTILLLSCFAASNFEERIVACGFSDRFEQLRNYFRIIEDEYKNCSEAFVSDVKIKPIVEKFLKQEFNEIEFSEDECEIILDALEKQFSFITTGYISPKRFFPALIIPIMAGSILFFKFENVLHNIGFVIILASCVFGIFLASRMIRVSGMRLFDIKAPSKKSVLNIKYVDFKLFDELEKSFEIVQRDVVERTKVTENFGCYNTLMENQHFKNLCEINDRTEIVFKYLFEHSFCKYDVEKNIVVPIDFPGYAIAHFYYDRLFGYSRLKKKCLEDFLGLFGLEKLPKLQAHDGIYNKWDDLVPKLNEILKNNIHNS